MSKLANDVRSSFTFALLTLFAVGCAKTQTPGEDDNGNTNWLRCETSADCKGDDSCVRGVCTSPSGSAGEGASDASSTPSAATGFDAGADRFVGGPPTVVEGERLCGGVACASGQQCCYRNGTCFDPSDATACPAPLPEEVPFADPGATLCASDGDCPEDEACWGSRACLGAGFCQSITNCGSSDLSFCGCDGRDYPNYESACMAGARIATEAPCGVSHGFGVAGTNAEIPPVTGCGNDADCSSPEACCQLTGLCYDTAQPILCTLPPEGTMSPCLEDAQCSPGDYCKHEGCEGPGGCVSISGGECGGRLEPVCGCDGTSYTSAECADAAGTNVSHSGACEG